jgi:hypothetical protein
MLDTTIKKLVKSIYVVGTGRGEKLSLCQILVTV